MASRAPCAPALSMASAARRAIESATSSTSSRSGSPAGRPSVRYPKPRPRATSRNVVSSPRSSRSCESARSSGAILSSAFRRSSTRRSSACQTCWSTGSPRSSSRCTRAPDGEPRHHDLAGDGHRHLLVEGPREQDAGLGHERQPAATLALGGLQPGPVRGQRERVRELLELDALVVAEPVPAVRGDRERADHPPRGDHRHRHQRPGGGAVQRPRLRGRLVGDHHGQVRVPRVRRTRLAGGQPGTAHRVRQPADRDHLELVLDVVADEQVRRVRVERVPHALGGQRQVVVDREPQQRVAAQPERVGVASRRLRRTPAPAAARGGAVASPGPAAGPNRRRPPRRSARRTPAPGCRPRPAASRRPARRRAPAPDRPGAARPRTGSTSWWNGRPTTCSGCHPNIRVASGFHSTTVPAASSSTTATAVPCTVTERASPAGRPVGAGRAVPVADQPHPLGGLGVLDAPRRGEGGGDEQAAATLGVAGRRRHARSAARDSGAGPPPRRAASARRGAGRPPPSYRYGPLRWSPAR